MLHSQPQITRQLDNPGIDFADVNRLTVLMPDLEADEARLGRQIYSLARDHRLNVLLISLVGDPGNEYRALRRMTSLAAIIRDSRVDVETQVLFGHSWIKPIKSIIQPQDLIICSEGQTTLYHLFQQKPLDTTLSMRLHRKVYTIPYYFEAMPPLLPSWMKRIPYWIGVAVILVGFFFLETDINHMVKDWAGQFTLLLLVLIEAAIIFGWTLVAG